MPVEATEAIPAALFYFTFSDQIRPISRPMCAMVRSSWLV